MLIEAHLFDRHGAGPDFLTLLLENASSDMVTATLSFQLNEHTRTQKVFLPSGRSAEVNTMTLAVTDLSIELDFMHGDRLSFQVPHPQDAWISGYGRLRVTGDAPRKMDAKWLD